MVDNSKDKHSIITSIIYFDTKTKIHIASEYNTVNTLCGKKLGFNYEPYRGNTYEYSDVSLYSKDELLKMRGVCKLCLKNI